MIRTFAVSTNTVPLLALVPAGSTIINTSDTYTVWVSGDTGLAVNNGVPVRPLSSVEKPKDGPLYAILDAPANTVVTVIIGDDVSGYNDPVALAAAVATKIAAKGVPNVLTETTVTSNQLISPNASWDVSGYASLIVIVSSTTLLCEYDFLSPDGFTVDSDYLMVGANHLNVNGATLKITSGAATARITIIGTNRTGLQRLDTRQYTSLVCDYSLPSQVYAAGQSAVLSAANSAIPQGLCQATFVYSTTVQGDYYLIDSQNNIMYISDYSLASAFAGGTTTRTHMTQMVVPPNVNFGFRAAAAGTALAHCQFVQSGLAS